MLTILTGSDNKILRSTAIPVTKFDQKLQDTADAMIDTMLNPEGLSVCGIGIAANQVGILEQIMIVTFNVETNKEPKIVAMINPEVVSFSKNEIVMEEGCLSLPQTYGKVSRPAKVHVRWQNLEGNWCEKKLDKWDARVFQHEYDHLHGKLFIDYLPTK